MKAKRKRSKYSPSQLKNYATSPCFVPLPFEDNQFTEEGKKLHSAVETGKLDGLDDEQQSCVKKCIAYGRALKGTREQEVRTEFRADSGGIIDLLVIDGVRAHVVDWKMGLSYQGDAEENFQGKAYALGTFLKYPKVQEVTVHFVYPRRDEVTRATFNRETDALVIQAEIDRVDAAVLEAAENNTRHPSDACRNCALFGTAECDVTANEALAIARQREEDMAIPEFAARHPSEVKDPVLMARLLKVARIMDKWAASVKFHASQLALTDGITPDGFEIKHRSGTRKIDDAMAAWAVAQDFLTQEEFIAACSVSVAKLEAAVREKAPRGKKKEAAAKLADELVGMGILTVSEDVPYLSEVKG
jgi:hypothetical protein